MLVKQKKKSPFLTTYTIWLYSLDDIRTIDLSVLYERRAEILALKDELELIKEKLVA